MSEENSQSVETLIHHEESRFSGLRLMLFKTSPRHRFVLLYDKKIPMGNYGSRAKPVIVKFKSGPAYDMLFLLGFLKKHHEKDWADAEFLSQVYFGDEVSLDTVHNYVESKLRGTLRKALKKVFSIEATDFIEREDHHYHLALTKENIEIDKSVFEFGIPQEGDDARKERFKALLLESAIEIQFPVTSPPQISPFC